MSVARALVEGSPEARFARAMANPLRSTVMYPPDRRLFAPFRSRVPVEETILRARGPIALYAHVPFCETKCTYCDYETVPLARHDAGSIEAYVEALVRELGWIADALPRGIEVAGFDLGGGTPGALSAAQFARILDAVRARFALAPGFEVSTETTPTLAAADPAKWRAIREAGVSRVSMGVQTAESSLLRSVARGLHGFDRVRAGMTALREAGFAMVNVDLMFALPGLSLATWMRTVEQAIALSPDVATIYDTVYKNRGIARAPAFPTAGDYGEQYDEAFARLTAAGYSARYGSVNFSRVAGRLGTSRYLESRILDGRDYLGAGLYASSLVGDAWRFGRKRYDAYLAQDALGAEDAYDLPRAHVVAKYVLLALSYGYLDAARFAARFGESLDDRFGEAIDFALSRGLLRRAGDGVELVPGSFSQLPGLRALFVPDDALPFLDLRVEKVKK